MKNLFDYINESLLDDEDVLIGNTKDDAYARALIEKIKQGVELNKDELKWCTTHTSVIRITKEELVNIVQHMHWNNKEMSLNWLDVSQITDMSDMFRYSMFDGDISKWDVSNTTNMASMFFMAKYTGKNGDISKWDVSKVESMSSMFAHSKYNGDLSKWNVKNVVFASGMFNASSFDGTNGDISKWNTIKFKNTSHMFSGTNFNQDLNKWNMSNVLYMSSMFADSNFNGEKAQYLDNMFNGNKVFNKDISNWKLISAYYVDYMFCDSNFNRDLKRWGMFLPKGLNTRKMFLKSKVDKENRPKIKR